MVDESAIDGTSVLAVEEWREYMDLALAGDVSF